MRDVALLALAGAAVFGGEVLLLVLFHEDDVLLGFSANVYLTTIALIGLEWSVLKNARNTAGAIALMVGFIAVYALVTWCATLLGVFEDTHGMLWRGAMITIPYLFLVHWSLPLALCRMRRSEKKFIG